MAALRKIRMKQASRNKLECRRILIPVPHRQEDHRRAVCALADAVPHEERALRLIIGESDDLAQLDFSAL